MKLLKKAILLTVAAYFTGFGLFWALLPTPKDKPSLSEVSSLQGLAAFTGGTGRIHTVASYIKKGFSGPVLITGVNPEGGKNWILSVIPEEAHTNVEFDYIAQTTRGNARQTLEWARENHIQNLGLVTSHYHIPRSLMIIKQEKALQKYSANIEIHPIPVFPEEVDFPFMLREFNKYIITPLYPLYLKMLKLA